MNAVSAPTPRPLRCSRLDSQFFYHLTCPSEGFFTLYLSFIGCSGAKTFPLWLLLQGLDPGCILAVKIVVNTGDDDPAFKVTQINSAECVSFKGNHTAVR